MVTTFSMIRLACVTFWLLSSVVSGQTFGDSASNSPFPLGPFRILIGGGLPSNEAPSNGLTPADNSAVLQKEKPPLVSARQAQATAITTSTTSAPTTAPIVNEEWLEYPSGTTYSSPSSSTTIAQAASISSRPSIATSSGSPSTTNSLSLSAGTVSTTSTTTTSTTVTLDPATGTASPSATPTGLLGVVPNSTSNSSMSAPARTGLGLGVTFGLISVASITAFYLYRRQMNKRHTSNNKSSFFFPAWKPRRGWLKLGREKSQPKDMEWEIASAEQVEIVRGASARTVSRSESRNKGDGGAMAEEDGGGKETKGESYEEIVRVGLQIPEATWAPNSALNSHPPTWPLPDKN